MKKQYCRLIRVFVLSGFILGFTACSEDDSEIVVGGLPEASFEASNITIETGETITFNNTTEGEYTQASWYFEGGSPSVSYYYNPEVTYNDPGVYDVNLIVRNENGKSEVRRQDHITVSAPPIYGSPDRPLSTTNWTVHSATTEQSGREKEYLIDGDVNTFWHSRWSEEPFGDLPEDFVIDMGAIEAVSGFLITQRQYNGRAGSYNVHAKDIVLEGSVDNNSWMPLLEAQLEQKDETQAVTLTVTGTEEFRYFRVTVLTAYNSVYTAIAEIKAF
ncbi:discoidin domain-containing protein [Zhouia amylolytica]|uniref:discoidin domain-containing protein n=1 Tax=Zhouia amylolytica TaxID=376730 RepID=UPI0020CC142F|nr:discoidin domain-containing protein [Zhouia amylolytica]MCQ0110055.1 discoidin domain-containing protein [Zhouia amylolytica]